MMLRSDDNLRVLLLAPQKVVGGITTWARVLLKYANSAHTQFIVVDTSKLYDPIGKKLGLRGAILGVRDALVRFCKIIKILLRNRPHLVYFTCAPSIGMIVRDVPLMILLRVFGKKCIVHLHGGDINGFFGGFFLRKYLARLGLRCCIAIFPIARDVEAAARKLFDNDKVIYVPNMLDDDFLAECKLKTEVQSGRIKIIHVAWQAPEKGSFDMVEAIRLVRTNIQCDLIGKAAPEYEKLLNSKISQYDIGSKIRLNGLCTGKDLQQFYEQADIFAMPTHSEGFPMVILEAMAYGLPVVATDVGNIREMIAADSSEPAGILLRHVNPVDATELAEVLEKLAGDSKLRATLGQNGRRRVMSKYLASLIVPKLEALLAELVDDKGNKKGRHEL
jgi:glycosyltransferase involved in cell wall biosynthesis